MSDRPVSDTAQEPEPVYRLMYRSVNRIPAENRKVELGRLFTQARSSNKAQQISGALLTHGDWFVQVLEGDEQRVRELFATIAKDPRHESVALLEGRPVDRRVFARWAMARVSEEGEPDIPLIAHTDGISRAAGRPTTAEQEELLDVMRSALHSAARSG